MRRSPACSGIVGVLAGMLLLAAPCPQASAVDDAAVAAHVLPPYQRGEAERDGVWALLDSGGGHAGWLIRSRPTAPLPGFAGEPIDLLITLDREGTFLDVTILDQHEPVFVSGLGQAPFDAFLRQYRGRSVNESLTVGAPSAAGQHAAASHVYLDGVSRATASVRIANETILAAARQVLRNRQHGGSGAASRPKPDDGEALDWSAMVAGGIVQHRVVTNAEVARAFADSPWAADDPRTAADPDGTYLDLWMADVGPPSVARALLDPATQAALTRVLGDDEEPILLLASGRHALVDPDFVRNTTPDRIAARQDDLPLALRHADVDLRLAPGVPEFDQALLLRIDRRLGFDPAAPWTLDIRAVREHGSFRPEREAHDFSLDYTPQPRFYESAQAASPSATHSVFADRAVDLALLTAGLVILGGGLLLRDRALARWPAFPALRLAILAVTVAFVGFWGQGQLSIVTPLGVLGAVTQGHTLAFLLYDPFSLVLWAATLVSLLIWGRGFFCGWLCPYGALQEFAHRIGRWLGLPEARAPDALDRALKRVKYGVLAMLIASSALPAGWQSTLVEVEPFKTAITLAFQRETPFVLYAAAWLVLGGFTFKPFCRYVCPLGALLALLGRVRQRDWISRRPACGSPCQYCRVQCSYGAIERSGAIDYAECFQCLDCVRIDETPTLCVADRLARDKGRPLVAKAAE